MNRYEEGLSLAVKNGVISAEQAATIRELSAPRPDWWRQACFALGGVLLFGALLFLLSGYWRFLHGMTLAWLTLIAGVLLTALGVWQIRRGARAAGTIFALAGICLLPVGVHNLWKGFGLDPTGSNVGPSELVTFRPRHLALEGITIAASAIAWAFSGEGTLLVPSTIAVGGLVTSLATFWTPWPLRHAGAVFGTSGIILLALTFALHSVRDESALLRARSVVGASGMAWLWVALVWSFPLCASFSASLAILVAFSLLCLALGAKFDEALVSTLGCVGMLHALYLGYHKWFYGSLAAPWVLLAVGALIVTLGVRGLRKR